MHEQRFHRSSRQGAAGPTVQSPHHRFVARAQPLQYNRGLTTGVPMPDALSIGGRRIAVLVEQEFEDRELIEPVRRLREAGAEVVIVGPAAGADYRGRGGETVRTDIAAGAARIDQFDAVVIPGGYAPDRMRMRHAMVDLVRAAMAAGRPVAAICHGPQVLISANVLRGRTLTCWPSIAVDVKNAGGRYVDRPVVEDGNLITSRKPDDVPQFSAAIIRVLAAASRAT
jgi:protease I